MSPTDPFLPLQQALKDRYVIERELGRGGMAIVYLARELALDRRVALKLLRPTIATNPAFRERFLREARTAARLSHPNILPIHAVDQVGEFVFFTMAYVDGEILADRIGSGGPLPAADATRVLRDVARAVAYAHAQGVIHRDLKADNILLEHESARALRTARTISTWRAASTIWVRFTGPRRSTPRPSRSTPARSRSTRRCWAPSIPTWQRSSTISGN